MGRDMDKKKRTSILLSLLMIIIVGFIGSDSIHFSYYVERCPQALFYYSLALFFI